MPHFIHPLPLQRQPDPWAGPGVKPWLWLQLGLCPGWRVAVLHPMPTSAGKALETCRKSGKKCQAPPPSSHTICPQQSTVPRGDVSPRGWGGGHGGEGCCSTKGQGCAKCPSGPTAMGCAISQALAGTHRAGELIYGVIKALLGSATQFCSRLSRFWDEEVGRVKCGTGVAQRYGDC